LAGTNKSRWKPYIYINKDGNPSTKSTRHVEANVNTWKENQDHQNNSNEVEDAMLKGILYHKSASDGGPSGFVCRGFQLSGLTFHCH
jgi:hypothetical protein